MSQALDILVWQIFQLLCPWIALLLIYYLFYKIIYPRYEEVIYVSLTGITSIDSLKRELAFRGRGHFVTDFFKYWGAGDETATTLAWASFKNQIVCLDDLERTKLDLEQCFGVISELKEKKSCRVLLIFNETKFNEGRDIIYQKNAEKVIDEEFEYTPSSEDSASIVFPTENREGYLKFSAECCEKLGIINVRIIQRIKYLTEKFPFEDEICKNWSDETWHLIIAATAMITYAHLDKATNSTDASKEKRNDIHTLVMDSASANDKWHLSGAIAHLQNHIQYNSKAPKPDFTLNDFIQRGWLDENKENPEKFLKWGNELEAHVQRYARMKNLTEFMEKHFIFQKDQQQFVEDLITHLKDAMEHLSIADMNYYLCILGDLGDNQNIIKELIDLFVEKNDDYLKKVVTDNNVLRDELRGNTPHPILGKRLEDHISSRLRRSLKEVMAELDQVLRAGEIDILHEATKEDFINVLLSLPTKGEIHRYINGLLNFSLDGRRNKEKMKDVKKSFREALEAIKNSERPIDALLIRLVEYYRDYKEEEYDPAYSQGISDENISDQEDAMREINASDEEYLHDTPRRLRARAFNCLKESDNDAQSSPTLPPEGEGEGACDVFRQR